MYVLIPLIISLYGLTMLRLKEENQRNTQCIRTLLFHFLGPYLFPYAPTPLLITPPPQSRPSMDSPPPFYDGVCIPHRYQATSLCFSQGWSNNGKRLLLYVVPRKCRPFILFRVATVFFWGPQMTTFFCGKFTVDHTTL